MQPIHYGGAILRRWWLIAIVGCVGLLLGVMMPSHSANSGTAPIGTWKYQASVTVGAAPTAPGAVNPGVTSSQIEFYASDAQVIAAAAKDAGLTGTPAQLANQVLAFGEGKFVAPGQVELDTFGPTPATAAAFANAMALELGKYIDKLRTLGYTLDLNKAQSQVAALKSEYDLAVISKESPAQIAQINAQLATAQTGLSELQASPPTSSYQLLKPADAGTAQVPASKSTSSGLPASHKFRAVGGLIVGLLLGLGLALLLELLDKRIREPAAAAAAFDLPVVAEIPASASPDGEIEPALAGVTGDVPSPTAEAYRMLRMSVVLEALAGATSEAADSEEVGLDGVILNGHRSNGKAKKGLRHRATLPDRRVVLVVSPGLEGTRSSVVANLAASFAETGQRVVVLSTQDLHSRRPAAGRKRPPMRKVDVADITRRLQPSFVDNVSLLSMSQFASSSGELVTTAPAVVEAALKAVDVVLLEAPALLAYHDAEALSPVADVVVVVAESLATSADEAGKAGDLLRRISAPVLGVVFTNVKLGARDVRRTVGTERLTEVPLPQFEETAPDELAARVDAAFSGVGDPLATPAAQGVPADDGRGRHVAPGTKLDLEPVTDGQGRHAARPGDPVTVGSGPALEPVASDADPTTAGDGVPERQKLEPIGFNGAPLFGRPGTKPADFIHKPMPAAQSGNGHVNEPVLTNSESATEDVRGREPVGAVNNTDDEVSPASLRDH